MERYLIAPQKIEMKVCRLYWNDKERLRMIGLLLGNVGVDAVVRLGNPEIWREAVAEL